MKRKFLPTFLTLSLLLGLCAGCGGSTDTAQTTTAQTETAPAASEAAAAETTEAAESAAPAITYPLTAEPTTVSMWFAYSPDLIQLCPNLEDDNKALVKGEEMTGVTLDFTYCEAPSALENFNLMVASGDYPDILDGAVNRYSGGTEQAIDDNVIMDLSGLLADNMPNYYGLVTDDGLLKDMMTDEGHIGDIKSIFTEPQRGSSGPIVRKDWLDKFGLDVPQTYDEYEQMLKDFATIDGVTTPMLLNPCSVPEGNYLVAGYGVAGNTSTAPNVTMPFYQVDGEVHFGILEDGFKQYITMLNKWYNEGLFYADYCTDGEGVMMDLVTSGQCGLWYSGSPSMFDSQMTDVAGYETIAIPDAVQTVGDVNHFTEVSNTRGSVSLSATCADPALTLQFLDFWFTQDGFYLVNYGTDECYTVADDGTVSFTDLILNNPDGLSFRDVRAIYCCTCVPGLVDMSVSDGKETEADLSASATWCGDNDDADVYPSAATLSTDEATTFNKNYSDIQTLIDEALPKFVLGETPMSQWDDFISQLKEYGIDDCIALKQAAYDRYCAR